MANGWSVTTASRKMMVRPASRMLSAISLGVFCRSAPSTKAIILSRKVSPGFDVMRTLITSESTRVPPVTADRSPPASRITGADSPVMADSSTEATPSVSSPSPGTRSLQVSITRSPDRSFALGTVSIEPFGSKRLATVSDLALRSVSACALPRPSAMASAKFANSTVNQSQSVICKLNAKLCFSRNNSAVVTTLPTSTTNMTGFFIMVRGSSLTTASTNARRMIFASHKLLLFFSAMFFFRKFCLRQLCSECFSCHHQHRHLHVVSFNLLAEILWRSPDHKAGNKHRQQHVDQDAVHARAHSSEYGFAQHDIDQRHHATQRSKRIMPAVDRTAARIGGDGREQRGIGDAETHFLAF